MTPFTWFVVAFLTLLVMGQPVAFAIAIASFVGFAFIPDPFGTAEPYSLLTDMTGGMNQLALIAIPFFILAGRIMGQGGIATRLIGLSQGMVGWVRGGTSYVSVLSSMFFGGVSGSAVADASSIGSVMIPMMDKEGYDLPFATAVTISASTLGLIIPPSNVMILYSVIATGTPAPAGPHQALAPTVPLMFLSGFLPGVIVAISLMACCGILSAIRGYPKGRWLGLRVLGRRALQASLALGVVVIILGGILFGWMTPEESAAVAVIVAIPVAVWIYREMRAREMLAIVHEAVLTTGVVFFLIAASNAMKYVFIHERIDQHLYDLSLSLIGGRTTFLLVVTAVFLVCGTFLDMTPAVLIFTPLFLPVAVRYGVHPIHFGIILLVAFCIGLCTPPVGNCLFVGCGLSGVPLTRMIVPLLPFYAAMVAALLAVTFIEPITMWLPGNWARWFPPAGGP